MSHEVAELPIGRVIVEEKYAKKCFEIVDSHKENAILQTDLSNCLGVNGVNHPEWVEVTKCSIPFTLTVLV